MQCPRHHCVPTVDAARGVQADDTTSQTLDFRIASPPLSWARGQNQTQSITVQLDPTKVDLASAAILVQLVNATNADVDDARGVSLVTAIPAASLTTTFTLQPNQVGALGSAPGGGGGCPGSFPQEKCLSMCCTCLWVLHPSLTHAHAHAARPPCEMV